MMRNLLSIAVLSLLVAGCQSDDLSDDLFDTTTSGVGSSGTRQYLTISGSSNAATRGTLIEGDSLYTYFWDNGDIFAIAADADGEGGYDVTFYAPDDDEDDTNDKDYLYTTAEIQAVAEGQAELQSNYYFNTDMPEKGAKIVSVGELIEGYLVFDEDSGNFVATLPTNFETATTFDTHSLFVQGELTMDADYSESITIPHTIVPAIFQFNLPDPSNEITVEYVKLVAANESKVLPTSVYLYGDSIGYIDGKYTDTVTITNDQATSLPSKLYGFAFPVTLAADVDIIVSVNGTETDLGTLSKDFEIEGGTVYVFELEERIVGLEKEKTLHIGVDAITATLATFTPSSSWTATSDSDWLTISSTNASWSTDSTSTPTLTGDANTKVTLTYSAASNLTITQSQDTAVSTRTATVTITQGTDKYIYTIGQDAGWCVTPCLFTSKWWQTLVGDDTITYNSEDSSVTLGSEGGEGSVRIYYGTEQWAGDGTGTSTIEKLSVPFGKYEFDIVDADQIHSYQSGYVTAYAYLDTNGYEAVFATLSGGKFNARYINNNITETAGTKVLSSTDYVDCKIAIEIYDTDDGVGAKWYLDGEEVCSKEFSGNTYYAINGKTSDYQTYDDFKEVYTINVGAQGLATATFAYWSLYSPVTKWSATTTTTTTTTTTED